MILIAGLGRCGTSIMTGMLHKSGQVNLGPLEAPKNTHYEAYEGPGSLLLFNNVSWRTGMVKGDVREKLKGFFDSYPEIDCIKMSRAAFVLPIFKELFPELRVLYCIRELHQHAKALSARTPDLTVAEARDCIHRYDNVMNKSIKFIAVDFETWFGPHAYTQLKRIFKYCGLTEPSKDILSLIDSNIPKYRRV